MKICDFPSVLCATIVCITCLDKHKHHVAVFEWMHIACWPTDLWPTDLYRIMIIMNIVMMDCLSWRSYEDIKTLNVQYILKIWLCLKSIVLFCSDAVKRARLAGGGAGRKEGPHPWKLRGDAVKPNRNINGHFYCAHQWFTTELLPKWQPYFYW